MIHALRLTLASMALLVFTSSLLAQQPGFPAATQEHQRLAEDVGAWDAAAAIWSSPDGEAETTTATETVRMLGDLWQLSYFKGKFGEMEYSGHGQTGYDPQRQKYVGTWVDSLNPHLMTTEGHVDQESGKLILIGTGVDAMTGQEIKTKLVSWQTGPGQRLFEMYHPVAGQEGQGDDSWWKMMEIRYTRR